MSFFMLVFIVGFNLVVGRDSVLAVASDRSLSCGNRLVSGLFSRPKLPLGYSYVTTVPKGACRINVSEGVPSENFIALKITNKTFIFNGEFAISSAGNYEAVGTQFYYVRFGGQDSVYAAGPIQEPIDIMILYTQPGSNIKYEYLTESLDDPNIDSLLKSNNTSSTDLSAAGSAQHGKRHRLAEIPRPNIPKIPYFSVTEDTQEVEEQINTVGARRFKWKVISYSPCTRTCGGGIQIGKYRCIEDIAKGGEKSKSLDKEVSPIHCSGAPPPQGRRRRCGNTPCPPRWRTAAWSTCPQCGPARKTRIVGCVQDHARGIIKINDQKCPRPKPVTVELCDIPDCKGIDSADRDSRSRDHVEGFRDGPVYTISLNNSLERGPSYSFSAAAGWLFTEWSECVGWCIGGGTESRGVRCTHPAGCSPLAPPAATRPCRPRGECLPYVGTWFTGEWSACPRCGGVQVRGVLCVGGSGRHLRDTACAAPRPATTRECAGDCGADWYFSEWGKCLSNCSSSPPSGTQRRTVVCSTEASGNDDAHCDAASKPLMERSCEPKCDGGRGKSSEEVEESNNEQSNVISSTTYTTYQTSTEKAMSTECEDKLNNCALAVQARLCHYNFYIQNCCSSCKGR